MTSPRAMLLRSLALFTAMLCLAGTAFASATSGTIKGTVIDDGGLAIPGALVTLTSPAMIGGAQQRTSDDNGEFLFVELAPGKYDMQVQKQGFGPVRKNNIEVLIGRTTTVNIEMKYGGETVVIEEKRKVVDTEKVSTGTTFTSEYLTRIPSGRDYQSIVGQTAGVVGGGNSYSQGAASDENTYLLDGVNVTDPVTGTFGTNFNFDAIESIEVITGGFDPEYGASLGATESIVTKSGGNTMEVVVDGYYDNANWAPKNDSRFTADGYELSPTGFDSAEQRGTAGATVSGPIVRDRVWFIGSYEYNRSLYQSVGVRLPWDFESHYFFGKITAQPSSAHRFSLTFNTDPTTIDNVDLDKYTNADANSRQYQVARTGALKWNWFINPEANLETSLSLTKQHFTGSQVPCTHDEELGYNPCSPGEAEGNVDYTTPARIGTYGAYSSENASGYQSDNRWSAQLVSKFSLLQVPFAGKHDIKAGIDLQYQAWDWTYAYPGNLLFVDLYLDAFNPDTYTNYYWLETSGVNEYEASGYFASAFLQDVYKPIDNLTFRYGLRYDHGTVNNDAGTAIFNAGVFGPRVYASWDPWADEKTKIYGGYGRFSDIGNLGLANYLSTSGYGNKYFWGEVYDNAVSTADQNAGEYDTSNDITFLDGLNTPHTDQVLIGAQREIVTDLSAKVEFTGKFTRNIYSFDETNLVYDEDGYGYIGESNGSFDYLYRLRAPSIARRDYFQTDINVQRNMAQRWLLGATYSYVVSRGTTQFAGDASLSNPSQLENAYGNLATDLRHQVKLAIAWDLPNDPWTTKVGAFFQYFSGDPVTRYYYSASGLQTGDVYYDFLKEPIGTYARFAGYAKLDVQVTQKIPVDKGDLEAYVALANVFNATTPTSYYSSYVSAYNRYIIADRQDVIQASLGARYNF